MKHIPSRFYKYIFYIYIYIYIYYIYSIYYIRISQINIIIIIYIIIYIFIYIVIYIHFGCKYSHDLRSDTNFGYESAESLRCEKRLSVEYNIRDYCSDISYEPYIYEGFV